MADRRVNVPPGFVDVPTSAAGPEAQKQIKGGKPGEVIMTPGSAHQAREGTVLSPGVKTVSSAGSGPTCPRCNRTGTLKMRMNKKLGHRVYCSAKDCSYDTSQENEGQSGTRSVSAPKPVSQSSDGVRILKQSGPRG